MEMPDDLIWLCVPGYVTLQAYPILQDAGPSMAVRAPLFDLFVVVGVAG